MLSTGPIDKNRLHTKATVDPGPENADAQSSQHEHREELEHCFAYLRDLMEAL